MQWRWRRAIGTGVVAVVIACSSYSATDDAAPPSDGGIDGDALAVDASDGGSDAATDSGAFALRAPCPPSRGASCDPKTCMQRMLYVASRPEEPHGLATDKGHVYVATQPVDASVGDAYNGSALATILRIDKATGTTDVLVTGEPSVRRIVLEGDSIDWAIVDRDGSAKIRGVRRDCAPPCTPVQRGAWNQTIVALASLRAGEIFALDSGGNLVRVDLVAGTSNKIGATSPAPDLAVTNDRVYVVGTGYPALLASIDGGPANQVEGIPFDDGGDPGFDHLATDCTTLFAARSRPGAPQVLWFDKILGGAGLAALTDLPPDVYGLAADATHVWEVSANAGGVHARAMTGNKAFVNVYFGNVFDVVIDDEGVYWGEHGTSAPGTISMLVK